MSRTARTVLTAVVLNLVCVAIVVAGEAGAPRGIQKSILTMIIESGWVEYVLILLSIVGFAIGIHRMLTIKNEVLVPPGLTDDLHNIFQEGVTDQACEDALNTASNDRSMLGEMLAAALDKREFGFEAMSEAATAVSAAEHNKFMTQIALLSLFAAIAPMLGLLGTVWGMIGAFMKMASYGSVDPNMLSSEIGGAMITTATGLIIAIPMMLIFFFLRARVNRSLNEAVVLTNEILDYFRARR